MKNIAIILIHGMGTFTEPKKNAQGEVIELGSFGKEFVEAANAALRRYPGYTTEKIEDRVEIYEIYYNDIFDRIRQDMADQAKTIGDFIGANGLAGIPGLITKAVSFERSLDGTDFFYTHWLDTLFYKTYWGGMIHARAAELICRVVSKHGGENVHIIAHSLGTGLLHDTLHKLYRHEFKDSDKIADLSPVDHCIKSLWMVANVSRLVNSVLPIADPYTSIVRPGNGGMTNYFFNCHHELDPFTWPKKFDPKPDGSWIASGLFNRFYFDIETALITDKNTHSFSQYIQDPQINFPLFRLVFGLPLTIEGQHSAIDNYDNGSIQQAYTELRAALSGFNPSDASSLGEMIDAAHFLKDFIRN